MTARAACILLWFTGTSLTHFTHHLQLEGIAKAFILSPVETKANLRMHAVERNRRQSDQAVCNDVIKLELCQDRDAKQMLVEQAIRNNMPAEVLTALVQELGKASQAAREAVKQPCTAVPTPGPSAANGMDLPSPSPQSNIASERQAKAPAPCKVHTVFKSEANANMYTSENSAEQLAKKPAAVGQVPALAETRAPNTGNGATTSCAEDTTIPPPQ